ncbi:MAG: cadherin-like beta sandwich domain-containing protein [Chitinivibrionales bacterium]
MITCSSPIDPFEDESNTSATIEFSSPEGFFTDSLLCDSTGNPVELSATVFLPTFVDSGSVIILFEDGSADTVLSSLFSPDSDGDNRTIDTTLHFQRGGLITAIISLEGRAISEFRDSASIFLFCKPTPLSNLSIEEVDITPQFSDTIYSYSATVENEQRYFTLVTGVENPFARIAINQDTLHDDSSGRRCSLEVGRNIYIIETIADDNSTVSQYTLEMIREPGSVATLDSILFSAGDIAPAFDSAQLSGYEVEVSDTADSLTVNLFPTHPQASCSIDDKTYEKGSCSFTIPLQYGDNPLTLFVKAEDQTTSKQYEIVIHRRLSDNASLMLLTAGDAELDPDFHEDTLDYTVVSSHDIDTLHIQAVAAHDSASARINDSIVEPGAVYPFCLRTGRKDTVEILVTAQNEVNSRTYRLFACRPPDSTARLSQIELSSGTLDPAFHSDSLTYTVVLPFADSTLTIAAQATDPNATVDIDGGSDSERFDLSTGENQVSIIVTAEDQHTTLTYALFIERSQNSNTGLSALVPSSGVLNPSFSTDIHSYALSVADSVEKIAFSVAPLHDKAGVTINNASPDTNFALDPMSETPFTIIVTAQDGTKDSYVVTVIRQGSALASLIDIRCSAGYLVPAFHPESSDYQMRIPADTQTVSIKPVATHPRASLTVKGNSVDQGEWSAPVEAGRGINSSFDIEVDSENGKQKRSYTIVVNRAYSVSCQATGNGTVTPRGVTDAFVGVPQEIEASPAAGHHFDGWNIVEGDAIIESPDMLSTTLNVDSCATVEGRFLPDPYHLILTNNGLGTASGPDTVLHGIADTIRASAHTGHHFVRWVVDEGSAQIADSSEEKTTVILTEGTASVQAIFALDVYTLELVEEGDGIINGPDTAVYDVAYPISAAPRTGYKFVKWEVVEGTAEIEDSTAAGTDIVLRDGDATVKAIFEPRRYRLTLRNDGVGEVNGPDSLDYGDSARVWIRLTPGHEFIKWKVTDGPATLTDSTTPSTFVKMSNGDAFVTAVFEQIRYNLEVLTEGNGSVGGPDSVAYAEPATITATADRGYYFNRWIVDSGQVVIDNPLEDTTEVVLTSGDAKVRGVFEAYDTIYVDSAATGEQTGLNWQDAFVDLQKAFTCANDYSVIKIARGTYYPHHTDRDVSFELRSGLEIEGGYGSGGSQRDDSHKAILSGEIQQDGDSTNNSLHILYADNLDARCRISNVVIEGGYGQKGSALFIRQSAMNVMKSEIRGNTVTDSGGALFAVNSNLYIEESRFARNRVNAVNRSGGGGAMFLKACTTDVYRCMIVNNSCFVQAQENDATAAGGAICVIDGRLTLTESGMMGNSSLCDYDTAYGGGIHNDGAVVSLYSCEFISNKTGGRRSFGGTVSSVGGTMQMGDCEIAGDSIVEGLQGFGGAVYLNNTAGSIGETDFTANTNAADISQGGALYIESCAPSVTDCFFLNNGSPSAAADGLGGALVLYNSSSVLQRCTFKSNHSDAQSLSSALFARGGEPYIINCTFFANSLGKFAACFSESAPLIIHSTFAENLTDTTLFVSGGADIINSIIWTEREQAELSGNPSTVRNCIIRGHQGSEEDSLFTANPLLGTCENHGGKVETIDIDETSIARDMGTTNLPDDREIDTDARGVLRRDGKPDIGAYEAE